MTEFWQPAQTMSLLHGYFLYGEMVTLILKKNCLRGIFELSEGSTVVFLFLLDRALWILLAPSPGGMFYNGTPSWPVAFRGINSLKYRNSN